MSFLKELQSKKCDLKVTKTLVTNADGQRYIESQSDGYVRTQCAPNQYGFIVDTKPDNIPALVIENLYLGSQDCTAENVLIANKIEKVLSVGIDIDVTMEHIFVPCLDLPETDINPVLEQCLTFIDSCLELKQNILVHCNAGVSRSAMIVIGYLIQCKNFCYEDAYSLVKNVRPAIQPNAGFVKQLKYLSSLSLNNTSPSVLSD